VCHHQWKRLWLLTWKPSIMLPRCSSTFECLHHGASSRRLTLHFMVLNFRMPHGHLTKLFFFKHIAAYPVFYEQTKYYVLE
jgi:hypothetical protein